MLGGSLSIAGRVTDPEGAPLADVWISVEPERGEGSGGDISTDAEGRFALAGLLAGTYQLELWPPEPGAETPGARMFLPAEREAVQAGRTDLEIALEPAVWLRGIVLDPAGRPVGNALVQASGPRSEQWATTEEDGRFHVRVQAGAGCDLIVRPQHPPGGSLEGSGRRFETDLDESHWARLSGVLGGGAEIVVSLP